MIVYSIFWEIWNGNNLNIEKYSFFGIVCIQSMCISVLTYKEMNCYITPNTQLSGWVFQTKIISTKAKYMGMIIQPLLWNAIWKYLMSPDFWEYSWISTNFWEIIQKKKTTRSGQSVKRSHGPQDHESELWAHSESSPESHTQTQKKKNNILVIWMWTLVQTAIEITNFGNLLKSTCSKTTEFLSEYTCNGGQKKPIQ